MAGKYTFLDMWIYLFSFQLWYSLEFKCSLRTLQDIQYGPGIHNQLSNKCIGENRSLRDRHTFWSIHF